MNIPSEKSRPAFRIIVVLLIWACCGIATARPVDHGEGDSGDGLSGGPGDEPISHESAHSAVPPPLGPVTTVQQANTPEIGTGALRSLVANRARQMVDATNADLAAQGKPYRASLAGVTAWSPYRIFTQYVDQPNQFYVHQSLSIKIDVDIPWASNRSVYLPLDIEAVCDGWHRSAGLVRFYLAPGAASVEGGNIVEEIIRVRDMIDAKVLANFPGRARAEEPQLNALADHKGRSCATIGVQDVGPDPNFHAITWSQSLPILGTTLKRIEVTPLTLRRLPATRIDTGTPIGDPVEHITLETYANFHAVATPPTPMQANDEIALSLPTMVLGDEPTTSLVVIGNVRNALLATTATAFTVTTQSVEYSPGTHTVQLQTEYWLAPMPPLNKPRKIPVATYALTYHVSYVPPPVINSPF